MIVTCPQCSTKYNVPLTAVPPTGRKTKCANCGNVWVEGAPPAEAIGAFAAAEAAPVKKLPPVVDERPVAKAVPVKPVVRKAPIAWGKIAASIAFIAITLVGIALLFRGPLADAFPAVANFYDKAGITAGNPDDWFDKTELKAERHIEGEIEGLLVSGTFKNISKRAHKAPEVRVFWQSGDGRVGPVVAVKGMPEVIEASEAMTFSAILTGMDMSRGGQAGAVLAGGRYDAKLIILLRDKPVTKEKAEAVAEPAHEAEPEHHAPEAAPAHNAPEAAHGEHH